MALNNMDNFARRSTTSRFSASRRSHPFRANRSVRSITAFLLPILVGPGLIPCRLHHTRLHDTHNSCARSVNLGWVSARTAVTLVASCQSNDTRIYLPFTACLAPNTTSFMTCLSFGIIHPLQIYIGIAKRNTKFPSRVLLILTSFQRTTTMTAFAF